MDHSPDRQTGPVADRAAVAALALAAITIVMVLQATRVFVSCMVFIIDQSERVQLGLTAGAVFVAIGLGALVPRLAGIHRALPLLAAGMIGARLLLQVWALPEARMWLGAAVILLAGWLLPLLLTRHRAATATGVGVGLAGDLAIQAGRDSIDLPLLPSLGATLLTVALGAIALVAAAALASPRVVATPATGSAIGALALGPILTLQHLLIGNLGIAQVRLDTDLTASAWLLGAGIALGIVTDALVPRDTRRVAMPALIVIGALGLLAAWHDPAGLGIPGVVIGTAATVAMGIATLRGGAGAAGIGATALWLTAGMVAQAAMLFAYFSATGMPSLIGVAFGIVALVGLLSLRNARVPRLALPVALGSAAAGAVALLVGAAIVTVGAAEPEPGAPLGAEFTVMTYNIQSGFSRDNVWDLEATARVIEEAGADIVLLQEVGRGWPILTGSDQARWLSHRLDMQLVWGPASRDDLWGNAILTRAPIEATEWVKFEVTENLRRGAVLAVIATEAGPITVVATHLDNPGDAESARQAQITQLLALWNGAEPALVGGDFNTDPDSAAMATLAEAGLLDTGAGLGMDATTSEDDRRIDYVLASPGLAVVETAILDTWVSDHRPFVAVLRIEP